MLFFMLQSTQKEVNKKLCLLLCLMVVYCGCKSKMNDDKKQAPSISPVSPPLQEANVDGMCNELFEKKIFGSSVSLNLKEPIRINNSPNSRLYFSVQKSTDYENNAPIVNLSCIVNGEGCSYDFEILFTDQTMLTYSHSSVCPTIIDCFSLNELTAIQRNSLLKKRINKIRFCGEIFEFPEILSQKVNNILNCISADSPQ